MRRALAALLALGGCTVGPNFEKPRADAPASFAGQPQDVASRTYGGNVDARWWTSFRDPELASLVDRLAAQNLDLQSAAERIEQARAERRIVGAQGLPNISGRANYTRQRPSENGFVSLVEPAPGAPLEYSQYMVQAQASWELDLFGRVRRQVEAAQADTQAAIEDRRALALSAIAELAQTYMQLRLAQAQEQVLRRDVAASQARSRLVRDRFREGAASDLEVAQADAQLSQISQDLPGIVTQQARLANALALLLAQQPRTLEAELAARPGVQPLVPPVVPVGLPSDLVRRRPDIREAEARLHAATADTGVAVADFFPRVSLSGVAGFDSLHAGTLFDWMSRMFMVGPTLSLPIFQGGRLTGNLQLRRSEQREAAIAYRKAVLAALHDVDNALTAYAQAQRARADADATNRANQRTLKLAQDRFGQGATDYLDVVQAQSALYASENAVVQANARIETSLVQLYKALGGGWEAVPEPTSARPLAR
ncbi:efflux transporter outer membrane subunit [Sphingomonas sp.]|uniref:efflux transporter outer membrane subunit n=1 Tax=Sphingomonas sp. TaxID=28214 RepID=UPI003B00E3E7